MPYQAASLASRKAAAGSYCAFAAADQSYPPAPLDIFPQEVGLVLADAYGAELIRPAPEHRLSGARRKAMLLRFGQAAAMRLHGLADPEAPAGPV